MTVNSHEHNDNVHDESQAQKSNMEITLHAVEIARSA